MGKVYTHTIFSRIRKEIPIVALVVGIVALMGGLEMFYKGYHNSDLGQNMEYLEEAFDTELIDYTSQGNYLDGQELYRLGSYQMEYGFYLAILGSFLIGFGIRERGA